MNQEKSPPLLFNLKHQNTNEDLLAVTWGFKETPNQVHALRKFHEGKDVGCLFIDSVTKEVVGVKIYFWGFQVMQRPDQEKIDTPLGYDPTLPKMQWSYVGGVE